MDSLSTETLAHIFTFISFHEITLNNILYTCFRYQSVFKYLLQYTKIRAWFIYNHYHISTKKSVFFTPSDCEMFLFKPNVSTSITTRLFNVSTKNKISNYSCIVNIYTNRPSLLVKLSSNKILLYLNKSTNNVEILSFER